MHPDAEILLAGEPIEERMRGSVPRGPHPACSRPGYADPPRSAQDRVPVTNRGTREIAVVPIAESPPRIFAHPPACLSATMRARTP